MPIYEFYCEKCNTIYNFFSRSINTDRVPDCPACKTGPLKKKVSIFATLSMKEETENADIDENRMKNAIDLLAKESGRINEDNPSQVADLMRRFSKTAGIEMGEGMEEALSRMEKGEDPDAIEQELGDIMNSSEAFVKKNSPSARARTKPRVDKTIYEL